MPERFNLKIRLPVFLIATLTLVSFSRVTAADPGDDAVDQADVSPAEFFQTHVRPILAQHCVQCHGPDEQEAELRLDTETGMKRGGESGPAMVPFQPDSSLIIDAVRYQSLEMPPDQPLDQASIDVLVRWVELGGKWPAKIGHPIRAVAKEFTEEDRTWWAIQPVTDPPVPDVKSATARNEIDQFIASKLQDAKLDQAVEADRVELVRRAYFDLHGLPPTPKQIQDFVEDDQPDAWQRLIDQLLDSPRYGERWAQHWLDVVRYADSDGYNEDAFRPGASAYRDYVIRSINDDKSYRDFVREQLAGDEIAPDDPDTYVATAYLRHGVYEWNQRNARMHWDLIVNELTRVTGEAFLGIGIGCAQCHDHKFDPILQKDYFSLQAFVSSVAWPLEKQLAKPEQVQAYQAELAKWEAATQTIRDKMRSIAAKEFDADQKMIIEQFPEDIQAIYQKDESERTSYEKQLAYLIHRQAHRAATRFDYKKALKDSPEEWARHQTLEAELKTFDSIKPKPLPKAFVATDVSPDPVPTYLTSRTSKTEVKPAFLTLLDQPAPEIKPTSTTTGRRTALADWIVREDNPFSTRVVVNRVWQRHFGRGIVATPNDFGTLGEPPSHPELLDWLTVRFVEGGWSLKSLHRLIMNSATYRQTSRHEPSETQLEFDPSNRLLWRFPPRRLDAEEVRDAMLAASGELKMRDVNMREVGTAVSGESNFRSIFVKRMRNKPDSMLRGFDAPLGFESAPDRIATTTPIQSLLLVNGTWSMKRANAFAKRLLGEQEHVSEPIIRDAYQIAFGRDASPSELQAAMAFIQDQSQRIDPPKTEPEYPNENGLRPIDQHFGSVKDLELGKKALWIQPGSRFERLQFAPESADDAADAFTTKLGDEFTIEAVTILDRLYPDASVNTLISNWDGSRKSNGWNFGVTSTKSAYQPRNLIVQLVGRTFQDEPMYEVVASGLRFPLGKPVYIAASIRAATTDDDPTSGSVTFFMKDLSTPESKVESAVVSTSVVGKIQNLDLAMIVGGRSKAGHQWDGQVARLAISHGALNKDQLLIGSQPEKADRLIDWKFDKTDAQNPVENASWLQLSSQKKQSAETLQTIQAVTDFCHALFNSNEFLYLH